MSRYEEKKQAKINRYDEYAKNSKKRSDSLHAQAKEMAMVIPFGQPILIGHHSEKGDRRYREKIEKSFHQSFKEEEKSTYWQNKADSIRENTQIDSDDPKAIKKLRSKIDMLLESDKRAKLLNSKLRKFKTYSNALEKLKILGDEDSKMLYEQLLWSANLYSRPPEPIRCYYYRYNSQEIRRLKKRLAYLEKCQKREPISFQVKDVTVQEEEGQIRVYFPGKPCVETRRKLKSYPLSLKWSRVSKAWVRKRTESTGRIFYSTTDGSVDKSC